MESYRTWAAVVTTEVPVTLSTELADREIFLIGSIVSQWGFLEGDIFEQTLLTFKASDTLPITMNNVQFSAVLKLWVERVVEKQDDARRAVLQAQYDEIARLSDFRQAVVHSRWNWRPDAPDEITAVRIHKRKVKSVKFSADELADFSMRLGQVRYRIRYPGGLEDHAAEFAAGGGYISRHAYELLSGRVQCLNLPAN